MQIERAQDHLLFPASSGGPLTRSAVTDRVRRAVQAARGKCASLTRKRVSPHTFRHTTAMHLLQSGDRPPRFVGWSSAGESDDREKTPVPASQNGFAECSSSASLRGETGEAVGGDTHQLRDGGDVPIRVGNLHVPDISRDGISHMIKSILLLAAQQRPADEGVAQILDSVTNEYVVGMSGF
jgi:hypothetical protein